LLGKDSTKKMEIKMDQSGALTVEGICNFTVTNPEQVYKIFEKGHGNRAVAATAMNATSSRSHSIFEIKIESKQDVKGKQKIRSSKLILVDLAGSERQAKTGATGQTLEEAKKINSSLSALGNVITALADDKVKFVP